ncbi:ketosteroid isomerase-like protein [Mycolicibacterium chubuense NBB4]|uniref:Ketosteroid isomerase-like protein n=1 Tax=Mycolicibacterium chubuense (strain NBB4) TaxID=710421 RepID=I4BJY4_MYCCN|nr:nuclear transport factor 2 family protein [Mycolicibacterium chubuense]AFM17591.1 ketosteroid isomerase-like protein [Mycolicibacterium chubuense NBB4]
MSEQEQNIDIIKRGYQAFADGDVETLMSLFDDNIEWVQPGESAISGTYHGKGELGEFLQRLGEKSPSITAHRFLADGDMVVVLSESTVGGETAHDVEVYTLRDGKTVRVEVCGDTAMMERQYGKKLTASSQ